MTGKDDGTNESGEGRGGECGKEGEWEKERRERRKQRTGKRAEWRVDIDVVYWMKMDRGRSTKRHPNEFSNMFDDAWGMVRAAVCYV